MVPPPPVVCVNPRIYTGEFPVLCGDGRSEQKATASAQLLRELQTSFFSHQIAGHYGENGRWVTLVSPHRLPRSSCHSFSLLLLSPQRFSAFHLLMREKLLY